MLCVACRASMLSHKTFGPSKPGLHSVPLLADSRRLRAHTGYSILDPCVSEGSTVGMFATQMVIRGRKRRPSQTDRLGFGETLA